MAKRPLQDVIPPRAPAQNRRPRVSVPESTDRRAGSQSPPVPPTQQIRSNRWPRRFRFWGIVIVLTLLLSFILSLFLSGTKLTIVPVQRDVRVDTTFRTFSEPELGQLGYDVMSLQRERVVTVPATGKETVSEKASGRIIVFNTHSSEPQQLVATTRFESPEGLIYRIDKAIVVPGEREVNGETVPGSIEVEVFADQSGDQYNIGLTDFTIPGFAGSARFDTFFARSKTPMTGGFSGTRSVVSETDRKEAVESLRATLAEELVNIVAIEKPADSILYGEMTFFTFNEPEIRDSSETEAEIALTGTLRAVLFEEFDLASFLASQTVAGYEGDPIRIDNPAELTVTITDKELVEPWNQDSFDFSISGNITLVWEFDADELQRDLAGKPKESLTIVLTGYPAIAEAEAVVRPFWASSFPDNPKRIDIKVVLDAE